MIKKMKERGILKKKGVNKSGIKINISDNLS